MSYNSEVNLILEKFSKVKLSEGDVPSPGFELSDRFINEFRRKLTRLRNSGMSKKQALRKIYTALQSHV